MTEDIFPQFFKFQGFSSLSHSLNQLLLPLLQGVDEGPEGLKLISDIIREKMGIDMSVLMGANIANEVAAEKFCETTIGEHFVHKPSSSLLHFIFIDVSGLFNSTGGP